MPIAVLSDDTSRAISSTLVLNDAVSVVKELLDNALDSHATNITIEVSANVLDIIQLKDNGAGVGVEDRQLLCKRNHTSKIRTIEDLAHIGGSSLGFRGEALSSIAELSESVLFTTRVDGESVASSMKFDSKGKLISSYSASHSTGTTVRVSNFLKNIPVRRQTALKDCQRVLGNIKKLLFDYALARPTIRYQFRVLKSQSNLKHNWSFVPCKDADNLSLIASKIVGKDIAGQCNQHSITSDDGALTIDALMITKECDTLKLVPTAKYISIDGRPVASEHGTMNDISKNYKIHLRRAVPALSNQSKPFLYLRLACPRGFYDVNIEPAKDQVLFEDTSAVLGLFDQLCKNVYGEPNTNAVSGNSSARHTGKTDEHGFDILLARKTTDNDGPKKSKALNGIDESPSHGKMASETTRDVLDVVDDSLLGAKLCNEKQLTSPVSKIQMRSSNESGSGVDNVDTQDQEDSMSPLVRNPFIIAKLNTRVRPQNLSRIDQIPEQRGSTDYLVLDSNGMNHQSIRETGNHKSMPKSMPSPSMSPERDVPYQNPGPPNRPWRKRHERDKDDEFQIDTTLVRTPETPKTTLLDRWAQIVQSSSSPTNLLTPTQVQGIRSSGSVQMKMPGFVRISDDNIAMRTSAQTAQQTSLLFHKNRDVTSSLEEDSQSVSPFSRNTDNFRALPSPADDRTEQTSPAARFSTLRQNSSTELDDIMDFEHRKRSTIQRHRNFGKSIKDTKRKQSTEIGGEVYMSDSEMAPNQKSSLNFDHALRFRSAKEVDDDIPEQPNSASYTQNPHQNRYRKAVRDLEERESDVAKATAETDVSPVNKTAGEVLNLKRQSEYTKSTSMSPHDPRAFLIRSQDDLSGNGDHSKKQSATRIAKLPFETIPLGQATYMLNVNLEIRSGHWTDPNVLKGMAMKVNRFDPYIRSGNTAPAFCGKSVPAEATLIMWEATCRRLLDAKMSPKIDDATFETPSDFLNLSTRLRKHFDLNDEVIAQKT